MEEGVKKRTWVGRVLAVAIVAVVVLYVRTQLTTFDKTDLVLSENGDDFKNCIYKPLGDGMLCVSRNGISFVDDRGRQVWKHSAEFAAPEIVTAGNQAVCCDRGGNRIVLVDEEGYKTEVGTPYPIERVAVSESGGFAALLENGRAPQVVCYSQNGKEKAKHQTSLKNRGYPLALALDDSGRRLAVSYLDVRYGTASGLVTVFDLESGGREKTLELPGNVVPEVRFYGEERLVLAGSAGVAFVNAGENLKIVKKWDVEGEIQKAILGDEKICIVSHRYGREPVLAVYDPEGEKVLSVRYDAAYDHVALLENEVCCYSGTRLKIVSFRGREKFLGTVPKKVGSIRKCGLGRKYLIGGDDGISVIRIRK